MSDISRPALTWATGLTRRELFAAMAMQGLLAHFGAQSGDGIKIAVDYADALLAELAKGGKA